ncbi:MAG: Uma2 family endonuclease [Thermus sp.]|uniref:Uma2 family endonuclease n=1 Tax=Thermus sp. TaxID=275 RepID=UPI00351AC6A6
MGEPARKGLDLEAYLRLEEESPWRHHLVEGSLWAMAGAGRAHNQLLTRLLLRLAPSALAQGCEAYAADHRLKVAEDTVFYPDLMVVCAPSSSPLYEEAPCLLVEILSPSTEALDRGKKLWHYLRLPSLTAYLLVHTERVALEAYLREGEGFRYLALGPGDALTLSCPPVTLEVAALYEGVRLGE